MKKISLELSDELAAGLERVAEDADLPIERLAARMIEVLLPRELKRLDRDLEGVGEKDEFYQEWYLQGKICAILPKALEDQKEKIESEMENGFFRNCAKLALGAPQDKDSPRIHFFGV